MANVNLSDAAVAVLTKFQKARKLDKLTDAANLAITGIFASRVKALAKYAKEHGPETKAKKSKIKKTKPEAVQPSA